MLAILRTVVLVVVVVLVTLFVVQNLAATEVAFLTWSIGAPRAVVYVLIFLLGLAAGALLISFRPRAKRRIEPPPSPPTQRDLTDQN